MKFWTFAGLLAGFVAISMTWKKFTPGPVASMKNSNKRYAIDELISDQEL